MPAPRQGGIPPLFWIILAGLVVIAVVAWWNWNGTRQGVSSDVSTPMVAPPRSSSVQSPALNPNPAAVAPAETATAPAASMMCPGDARCPAEETPPTGGSPLPQSDPDAD